MQEFFITQIHVASRRNLECNFVFPLSLYYQATNVWTEGIVFHGDADGTIFLLFSGIPSPSKSRGNETHIELAGLHLIDILNHNLSLLLMISMRPWAHSLALSDLRISIHSQVSVGPPKGAPRLFLKPSETIIPHTLSGDDPYLQYDICPLYYMR